MVVLVVDVLPNDAFTGVLLLLQLENVPDEELLQLLVGKVDAQLLKAAQNRSTNPTEKRREKKMDGL